MKIKYQKIIFTVIKIIAACYCILGVIVNDTKFEKIICSIGYIGWMFFIVCDLFLYYKENDWEYKE